MPTLPDSPTTVLFLLVGLALFGSLLWVFARHCGIAVCLLLGMQVWSVAAGGQLPFVSLGVSVYPTDVLVACALCVGLARLLRGIPRRAGLFPLLLLVGLTAWSTVYGIADFGLRTAGNDSRTFFWYFLASALYLSTLPAGAPLGRVFNRALPAAAVVYGALCLAGWAANGLHPVTAHLSVEGVAVDARPVSAQAALVMVQGALLLLRPLGGPAPCEPPAVTARNGPGGRGGGKPLKVALAVLLMAMVVLLEHRTVWVAVIAVAFTWWALFPGWAGRRVAVAAAGAVATGLAALVFAAGPDVGIRDSLATSAAEIQSSHSTLTWRLLGWQDLLDMPRSVVQWLAGAPFGSGYDRYIGGTLVEVSPHDYYLHVLLRLGAIGLLALVALYGLTLFRLTRGRRDGLTLCLVLVAQLVFLVGYSASPEQGIVLGLCMWQVRRARTAGGVPGPVGAPVPDPVPDSAPDPPPDSAPDLVPDSVSRSAVGVRP